ncbi:trimeric autotransporter adhesin [Acinetobacter calcoaceticus]|uniref:Trimeric autotransporter adhesin n=1 Tax=Acinetobacter calcoaceticus TaxID=471 RepID=A0A4V6NJD7_ACICA|nr:trimeric autotransporter adhesin [Acinetobacter calcoaceticus]
MMNKIYKCIWNSRLNIMVVVSESATGKSKSSLGANISKVNKAITAITVIIVAITTTTYSMSTLAGSVSICDGLNSTLSNLSSNLVKVTHGCLADGLGVAIYEANGTVFSGGTASLGVGINKTGRSVGEIYLYAPTGATIEAALRVTKLATFQQGASLENQKITNLANGTVALNSKDGINGGQLFGSNQKIASALGGGSGIDSNGNITAPSYSVGGTKVSSVGDAVSNLDGRTSSNTQNIATNNQNITSNTQNIATNTQDIATNTQNIATNTQDIATNTQNISTNSKSISDLNTTVTQGTFSVSANGTGVTKVAKDAVIDYGNTDSNIKVAQTGTQFKFDLADQLKIKTSVAVGGTTVSQSGLSITGGPSITQTGINAANTTISNLKDGVNATDAASKGQLDKSLKDAGLVDANGKAINAVTYDTVGNVQLKDNAGQGSVLSNVAVGKVAADSREAINGSQLYNSNQKVASALGGGSTVDSNGNITAPSYSVGGTKVSSVGDAVSNLDGRTTMNTQNITSNTQNINNLSKTLSEGSFSVSANATGVTRVAKDAVIDYGNTDSNIKVAQTGTQFKFDLADQLKIKTSVAVGGTTVSQSGLSITGGPSITQTGINAANTTISNLKDGVNATDAASKGQLDKSLKDAGLVDANGKAINAVTYDTVGNVQLKDNAGQGSVLSNVAVGKVAADSREAINGSQLYNSNQKVASALGGGSTVDSNGNIIAPSYSVGGTKVSSVGDAVSNLDGRTTMNTQNITSNTQNINNLSKTLSEGSFSVSANATGVTRVAKDAVIDYGNTDSNIKVAQTGTQFKFDLADQLKIKTSVAVGGTILSQSGLSITGGPSITQTGINAANTTISNLKDGVNANDAASKGQLDRSLKDAGLVDANGKAINAVTYDAVGNVQLRDNAGQGSVLSNVAIGKVAANSKDAINGSQLYNSNQKIASALGGGSTVDSNGNITAPSYNVGGSKVSSIGDAVSNLDGRTTTNTQNITSNTQNINNLSKTLSEGSFSVSANATGVTRVAKDAVIDYGNTDSNIKVAQTGTQFKFDLADQLKIKTSVAVGGTILSQSGLSITGGPSITQTGINAANTTISNLKDGVNATDAASKGQLDRGLTSAKQYTDQQVQKVTGGTSRDVTQIKDQVIQLQNGLEGMLQVSQEAPIVQPKATGTDTLAGGNAAQSSGHQAVALGNKATATAQNSVALGNSSLADRDNTVSVGSKGKERQVSNVAAGTADTDAANVRQLKEVSARMTETSDQLNQKINRVNEYAHNVDKNAKAGIAGISAMANIPQVMQGGQRSVGAGVGHYRGQNAVAIGGSVSSDSGKWVFKGSAAFDTQSKSSFGAGVSRVW